MKIAIYSGVIPSTTFIEALILELGRQGHKVLLFGRKNGDVNYPHTSIKKYYQPTSPGLIFLESVFYWLLFVLFRGRQGRTLYKLIRKENSGLLYFWRQSAKILPVLWTRPDVFHIQWAKALPKWIFLRAFDIRVAVSLRGAHVNYSPLAEPGLAEAYRKYFPLVDGFHAVSRSIRDVAALYNAPVSRTRVIYSYVAGHPPEVDKVAVYDRSESSPGKMSVVSVGRYHWKKGYQYALDAIRIMTEEGYDVHYTIVAGGDKEEYLYQVSDQKLENHVSMVPAMSHEEVLSMIAKSDVLLLSSVEEGIANVVLEAMSVGTIVVSTDCGGMNEVIVNNENGFLVPVRDPDSIARALVHIHTLTADEGLGIVRAAKQSIEEYHTRGKFADEIEGFYKMVVSGNG